MNILMVATEMMPLAKVGGLADVVGALPASLASRQRERSSCARRRARRGRSRTIRPSPDSMGAQTPGHEPRGCLA